MNAQGVPLGGIRAFGPVNLSNGPLLQLYKAVGAIDDPRGQLGAYATSDAVNKTGIYWIAGSEADVVLDQIHVGYGVGPPGAPAKGMFSRTVNVNIIPGDVLYIRGYNSTPAEWDASSMLLRAVSIRDTNGSIVSQTVTRVDIPVTYYFNNLQVGIPEPAALLFVAPGLALWGLWRKKR